MTSSKKLAETLIAFMGIWLIVKPIPDFIATLLSLSYFSSYNGNEVIFAPQVFFVVVNCICGALLIASRKKLVQLLGLEAELKSTTRALLIVSMVLLGVYFILNGIVAFGQHYGVSQQEHMSNPYLFWQGIASLAGGLIVVLASPFLGKLWEYSQG